jgi:hypothetical protein
MHFDLSLLLNLFFSIDILWQNKVGLLYLPHLSFVVKGSSNSLT